MPWIRVDDQFAEHPKAMALGSDRLPGLGLWHVAASYCARYLTDGFVPAPFVRANAPSKLTKRMVEVGLFDQVEGGYRLHDWLDYNPPRTKVMAERTAAKRRMFAKRSPNVRPNNNGTSAEPIPKFAHPVPVPVPVPEVLLSVPTAREEWVDPLAFYQERCKRRSLSQKERDWIEDLHARFSRTELVRALEAVPPGTNYLKRVDEYLEAA